MPTDGKSFSNYEQEEARKYNEGKRTVKKKNE